LVISIYQRVDLSSVDISGVDISSIYGSRYIVGRYIGGRYIIGRYIAVDRYIQTQTLHIKGYNYIQTF
jgi:hypothetical protein